MRAATVPKKVSMPVRVPSDCHDALRTAAFHQRLTISQVLADLIRKRYPVSRTGGARA